MKSLLTLMLLAATAAAETPKIVLRGNWPAADAKTIPLGDWRNYGVEGYAGKISWKYDALPELGTDKSGKPVIVYGDVAVKKVEAELTPVRFVDGKFDTSKVPAGDALVGGLAAGKIKLKAIGLDKDGFPDEIATLMIEVVGPRGPPVAVQPIPGTKINYLAIIRANAPATAEYTRIMELPAWKELAAKGVTVKDFTAEYAANSLGINLADGTKLPVVVALNNPGPPGKSVRIGLPKPLPGDDAGIRKLIEVAP